MRRAARRGLRQVLSERPSEHDVDDALETAFRELLEKGPDAIKKSLRGFASAIAYRRGQDLARKLIRARERIPQANWRLEDITPTLADEQSYERREHLLERLDDCMMTLTDDQRDLIENVVKPHRSLSSWTTHRGVTYEAGRRMRNRALEKLKLCLEARSAERD